MQKLLLTDYHKIKPFLDAADYEGFNSNFITMMMWNHEYHIQYEIHDHFLVMLQHYNDAYFFAMPFCQKEYIKEAIDYMLLYAKEHHFPFVIDGVTKDIKEYIQSVYHQQFMYQATPDNDDYVYDKKMLETLSGKKMQKRRNHYNAFIKLYPDFVYKEIEDEDVDNVLACLLRWDYQHEDGESIQSEFIGIMYLLMHRHELPIKTGCIYINGTLEAFTIASALKHQTIEIHIEKANKEIRGLYVAICKHFLENNYPDYVYVNREEDMGIPALRKAKQAAHPIHMVHKYQLYERKTKVRQATNEDTEAIIELWKTCFPDEDDASTAFYYQYCYQAQNTYVLMQEEIMVSAMQIVPFTIEKGELVYFILGVSTKPEFQHNGCMKEVMQAVLAMPYASHRIFLQAYVPAIYYPFGFHEKYYLQRVEVDTDAYTPIHTIILKEISAVDLVSLYDTYCQSKQGYRIRDKQYYDVYIKERCIAFNEQIKGVYEGNHILGYVIYQENETEINISELIYVSSEDLDKILRYFVNQGKKLIVVCDCEANLQGTTELFCTVLTNDLKEEGINKKLFINEIY